jgi:hypothetical protein
MRLSAATVGMLLGLVLVLSSCGEDRTAGAPPSTASPPAQRQPACQAQLGSFLGSLTTLRRQLARGLSYEEYVPAVRRVRAVYDRVPEKKLSAACLFLTGGPSEQALNLYIDAANSWGSCLTNAGCSTTSVEPKLQRQWARASEKLTKAQRAIKDRSR